MGIGVVALVVIVVAAVLLVPKGAKGEPISYAFEEGQSLNYRMRATMDGEVSIPDLGATQMKVEVGGVMRMNVVSVEDDGTATVGLVMEDLYVRSTPATDTATIPSRIEETLVIGPDGRLLEGSLGLSGLGATSQTPPGWDQWSPLLPAEPVSPGDSWSDEVEVPFYGGETITVSTESQLLDYIAEDGKEIAVVKSTMRMPLDVEVSIVDMLKEMGTETGDMGLPKGMNPTVSYSGQMDMEMIARIDPASQELMGTSADGTMNVDMVFKGVPGGQDIGPANLTMDMSMVMEQFEPRKKPTDKDQAAAQ